MLTACGEPATVAYRLSGTDEWSYVCAEHWNLEQAAEAAKEK
jgi:hypothetical protein